MEAQRAVGIEPLRDLYDLRHTYATFALCAGVPVFALSRFMGTIRGVGGSCRRAPAG